MKIFSEFLALNYLVGHENGTESYRIEVSTSVIFIIENSLESEDKKNTSDVLLKVLMKIFSVKHTTCFLSLLRAG